VQETRQQRRYSVSGDKRVKNKKIKAINISEDPCEELLANLTPQQKEEIRQNVLEGIAEADRGEYTEYVGRAGLKQLAEDIKARGRERLLAKQTVHK
jgi:hypothetical protein